LEHDRAFAAEFVRANYPGLSIPEEVDSPKNSAEGIYDFLLPSEDEWVIKPNTNDLEVFITDAPRRLYLAEAENYLKEHSSVLKDVTVQLQRRINGYECAVETWYQNGRPMFALLDIELKKMYAGNLPPQTGCSADLVFPIHLDAPLRKIANEPFDRIAREYNFTGLMDANIIFDIKSGKPYFLEFCPARFGYNCLYTFLDRLRDHIGDFFHWFLESDERASISVGFGASIRIFDSGHYNNLLYTIESGKLHFRDLSLGYPQSVWLWDAMNDNGKLKVIGANPNTAIVTTTSTSTPREALHQVKEFARQVKFEGVYFRYDIDETGWNYCILDRLEYLISNRLLIPPKRYGVTVRTNYEVITERRL